MQASDNSIGKSSGYKQLLNKGGVNKFVQQNRGSTLGTSNPSCNERVSQIFDIEPMPAKKPNFRSVIPNDRQYNNETGKSMKEDRQQSPIDKLDKLGSKIIDDPQQPLMNKLRLSSTKRREDSSKMINSASFDKEENDPMNSSMYIINQPGIQNTSQIEMDLPQSKNIKTSKISSEDNLPYFITTFPKYESKKSFDKEVYSSKGLNHEHEMQQRLKKAIIQEIRSELRLNMQEDMRTILQEQLRQVKVQIKAIKKIQEEHHHTQQHTNAQINRMYKEVNELVSEKNQEEKSSKSLNTSADKNSEQEKYSTLESENQKLKAQLQKVNLKNMELRSLQDKQKQIMKETKEGLQKESEFYKLKYKEENQKRLQREAELELVKSQKGENKMELVKSSTQTQDTKLSQTSLYQRPIFQSNILNKRKGEGDAFLRAKIQLFNERKIKWSQILFQKDKFSNNISNYLVQYPFPFVILMQSQKEELFGVFGQGIESQFTEKLRQKDVSIPKFKAFLFNLNRQEIFTNQHKTSITSCVYSENCLQIGNNEIILKNRELETVKVNIGNILGEVYFTLKHRQKLTGEQEQPIQLKALELHRICF